MTLETVANSPYHYIAKRNMNLAKMTDKYPNIATVFMKLLIGLEQYAKHKGKDVEELKFEVVQSYDRKYITIKFLDVE